MLAQYASGPCLFALAEAQVLYQTTRPSTPGPVTAFVARAPCLRLFLAVCYLMRLLLHICSGSCRWSSCSYAPLKVCKQTEKRAPNHLSLNSRNSVDHKFGSMQFLHSYHYNYNSSGCTYSLQFEYEADE
jgi:hypothetical protein